jgi:hypothetical protein
MGSLDTRIFMIRFQSMVFTGVKWVFIGVLNTVGWLGGVILILKRMKFWSGVKVFGRLWGEREILMSI